MKGCLVILLLLLVGIGSPAHALSTLNANGISTTGVVSATSAYFATSVGVGVLTPNVPMHISGTMRVENTSMICNLGTGLGLLTCTSDIRLKKDIQPIPNALQKLSKIKGVTFHWKNPKASRHQMLGVIAQDVQKSFPQAVSPMEDGTLTVDYAVLVAPLIQAVNELNQQNQALRKDLATLQQTLKTRH